ncbi:MAG: Fe-S oxidoreductase, partial [Bacteroidota bacterium]
MSYIDNVLFIILLALGFGYFALNVKKLVRNIKLGHKVDRFDNPKARWHNMALIALGQSKMVRRPVAGILHIIVYVGFIIINIELLEIIIDGIFGTHRIFAFMGGGYNFLIGFFEILAFGVIVSVVIFWIRRNVIKLWRFAHGDLKGWPKNDANIILYFETVLMVLFLTMNATDGYLQSINAHHYTQAGAFPISGFITPLFDGLSQGTAVFIE